VPDPTALTAIVGAAAGCLGAATPVVIARHNRQKAKRDEIEEAAEYNVTSWSTLNDALGREIQRLQFAMDRQRADYAAQLAATRNEYEIQLDAARKRITELETDVASLRRILGPPGS
jgi:gas vesicle protein